MLTKVQKLLDERNLKNQDLANYLKVSSAAFGNWVVRKKVPHKYANQIAEFFNVDVNYLLASNDDTPFYKTRKIAILGNSLLAVPKAKQHSTNAEKHTYYTGEKQEVYALLAHDESMEPEVFKNDTLLCEKYEINSLKSGQIIHFTYAFEQEEAKKSGIRVFKIREDGSIYLKALNPRFDDIEVKQPEFLSTAKIITISRVPHIY